MRRISPQSGRQRSGYTLVEMLISTSILALLFLGAMAIFIVMLRLCGSVNGAQSSSLDAANAIQRVTGSLREARGFMLMDGGTFSDTYDSKDAQGNYIAVTGIRIVFPAAAVNVAANTTLAGAAVSLTGTNALWNRQVDGATLDFYRSNADGTPNPNTGTCLWASGTENGVAVNQAVFKHVAPALDAVQFIQPYLSDGVTPIPNEVKVKITASYYDPVHGQTSSDLASGSVSQLTGECIYLRDHNPYGAVSGGVHGRTQN